MLSLFLCCVLISYNDQVGLAPATFLSDTPPGLDVVSFNTSFRHSILTPKMES